MQPIDITPDTSLLSKIGETSFSISQAISELIANSLNAMPPGQKAEIRIEADLNHIQIADNGVGMEPDILKEAVKLARSMKKYHPDPKKSKAEYGLGMKTACASLGICWSITTLPTGSQKGYKIIFDLENFAKQKKWVAELEDNIKKSEIGLPNNAVSGTVITVNKLKVKPIADNLKEELSRSYLPHIRSGDKFYLNGDLLQEKPLDIIPNTQVKVDKVIEGVHIHGWGALVKVGSLTNFGFHWFRKGQLIEAFDKSFIPNHPTYRQIIGELHADNMPVNFTKKGFETESAQWKQAIATLPELFEKLLREARKTRKDREPNPWQDENLRHGVEVMNLVGSEISPKIFDAESTEDYAIGSVIDKVRSQEESKEIREVAIRTPIKIGNTEIKWRHRFYSLGEEGPLVDYSIEAKNELIIVTNQDSPFSQIIEDETILAILNVAEAISRFLVEELKYDYTKAKKFRDSWLATASAVLKERI